MIKYIYVICGTIALALGIFGMVLPVLPTTPFLLLSAWLYFKGSKRLYEKLMNSKYFGPYIRDFRENKAIPLRIKIVAISMLWITILISAFLIIKIVWVRVLLLAIASAVTIHILSYKTKR